MNLIASSYSFYKLWKLFWETRAKKKDNTIIVLCTILVLLLAIFGRYFTASAIMKNATTDIICSL